VSKSQSLDAGYLTVRLVRLKMVVLEFALAPLRVMHTVLDLLLRSASFLKLQKIQTALSTSHANAGNALALNLEGNDRWTAIAIKAPLSHAKTARPLSPVN
jgi:hypothetical protein